MSDAGNKKKELNDASISDALRKEEKKSKLYDAITPSTSSREAVKSGEEKQADFWQEAIATIKSEDFTSLDGAIDRIVELSAEKLGDVAADQETRDFMKQAILDNEQVTELIRRALFS